MVRIRAQKIKSIKALAFVIVNIPMKKLTRKTIPSSWKPGPARTSRRTKSRTKHLRMENLQPLRMMRVIARL